MPGSIGSDAVVPRGSELPLLLLRGFRALIDDAQVELAELAELTEPAERADSDPAAIGAAATKVAAAEPDFRLLHGVVLDAIGEGITAAGLGRRLGVSKQAAAKTVTALEHAGYVERVPDPADARAKLVRITPLGRRALWRTTETMARHRRMWVERLGAESVDGMEEALRTMTAEG
ncbi:MarR family winged helix-turn-helix transcriptional regulator [Catenulispora pinisilvae]|uniref:MarR family winged helix-turn-helix transcriptional regulator n=1 Tax=Catenulispora pinisilvae TaxID=2705253 RepID=UPI002B27359C|nr:MarR family transcriptional regulator [Catenulispora pinisilvae]